MGRSGAAMPAEILLAYTEGVNAGLDDLRVRPWGVPRAAPAPRVLATDRHDPDPLHGVPGPEPLDSLLYLRAAWAGDRVLRDWDSLPAITA